MLRFYDLESQFKHKPIEVLHLLDRQVREKPEPDVVFALAELCYLCAKKKELTSKTDAMRSMTNACSSASMVMNSTVRLRFGG